MLASGRNLIHVAEVIASGDVEHVYGAEPIPSDLAHSQPAVAVAPPAKNETRGQYRAGVGSVGFD
jgi:hypothetical protein